MKIKKKKNLKNPSIQLSTAERTCKKLTIWIT